MIETKDDFTQLIKQIEARPGYKRPRAFGLARLDRGQVDKSKILQLHFAAVNYEQNYGSAAVLLDALARRGVEPAGAEFNAVLKMEDIDQALASFAPFLEEEGHENIEVLKLIKEKFKDEDFALVSFFEDGPPASVENVYLKLYLLSHKKTPLRSLDLSGAFALLHNVAWVDNRPIELDYLRANEARLKMSGQFPKIDYVDKFPRFLSHLIPEDNTRILDTAKVRLGAALGAGTTVMPGASYVNFNAGTTGACMIEGRVSSSAIVGEGSDVGGGASILGVLSGTNGNPVRVGRGCLLGANSVTGVPLGDHCVVDAGVAVLEGTKFRVLGPAELAVMNPNFDFTAKEFFKGLDLAGLRGLHFRQDSLTGAMVVGPNKRAVKLNEELH